MFNVLRSGADHGTEATGGEDMRVLAEFGEKKFEDAIDQAEIAVIEARLQAADGIGSDDAGGFANLDAGQAGGALKKCVGGNADAGADDSAHVLAFGGDAVEGGGGAEVYDDAGATVFFKCGHGVHDTVGADFGGVLGGNRQPGFDSGLGESRLVILVALAPPEQHRVQRGGDDDES